MDRRALLLLSAAITACVGAEPVASSENALSLPSSGAPDASLADASTPPMPGGGADGAPAPPDLPPPPGDEPPLPPPDPNDPPPPDEDPLYCVCAYEYGDLPAGTNDCVAATTQEMCAAASCEVRYMHPMGEWFYTTRPCGLSPDPNYYPPEPVVEEGCGCPVQEHEMVVLDGCHPDEDGDGMPDVERDECNYLDCWVAPNSPNIQGAPQLRSCQWTDAPEPPPPDEWLPDLLACGCPAEDPDELSWDGCGDAMTFNECTVASCGYTLEGGAIYTVPCELYDLTPPEIF